MMGEMGKQFERLMKDVVAGLETKHRNLDIKDVYNMMGMIGAEAERNAEFKTDLQNFLKLISIQMKQPKIMKWRKHCRKLDINTSNT